MPIVQISKIQHRTGANVDLPQLDVGEIGFSTDTRQVFIGNDPVLFPASSTPTTQTEILTEFSGACKLISTVPASKTAVGISGQIAYDSTYIYICIASGNWIRALRNAW